LSGHQHRRTILGAIAAAGAAVAIPAPVDAAADPHSGWAAEIARLRATANEHPDDTEGDAAYSRVVALEDLIAATPAGIAAQIKLSVECHDDGSTLSECYVSALRQAIGALERLGA
jgi:hypothetical protein